MATAKGKAIGKLAGILIILPLEAWLTQICWNDVMVNILGLPSISFWQSLALIWFTIVWWWPRQVMEIGRK